MAVQAALVITIPMVIDALSRILNIPKEKLQEYYDTSQALRDYITSITSTFNVDVQNELLQVTPSTTPRFDIPWITEELKKKQDDLFKLKKEITEIQTKAHESAQEQWLDSIEGKAAHMSKVPSIFAAVHNANIEKHYKKAFHERKKKESDNFTKQTANKYDEMKQVVNRPLRNNDPTYQSLQERNRNAQISKEK